MDSSDQNLLDADPFGFGRFQNTPEGKVIVLWDYENCPVPKGIPGLSAIRNIREAALKFGSIDQFEAYCDWSNESSTGIRNDLSISGVKLRDCPTKGWIGTVGKAIVVDMMVYALERPRTTTVLLISGDKDHAYAISTLRNRGYPVKLVAPTGTLHPGLQVFADLLDWNSIFRSDLPPTELVGFSGLAGKEEEETEEEDEETSEEEDEVEGEEEMEADETAQVQVGGEIEVGEISQLQVEAEKKVQVLVETDDEGDSGEPALPTPPQSESVATLAPAEISPIWKPAEPALPSKAVPLQPLLALAQERQEERPQPPRLLSPSPPTRPQTTPLSHVGGSKQPRFGPSSIQKPQTVPPSYGGGNKQPGLGAFLVQQPKTVPPGYGGASSQPGSGLSSIQKPQTVPPSYGGGSNQPGLGASSVQPKTVPPIYGGGSSQPGLGASVVQQRARYVPPKFEPLVRELEVMRAEGSLAPQWNVICPRVRKRCKTYLNAAGVNRWKAYVVLAEQEGLVTVAGTNGMETVSLKI